LKTESHNPGISLRVPDGTCEDLCLVVSGIPGVVITKRKRPYWTASDGTAEFTFRGFAFAIEPDEWDGVYWIMSMDHQKHEAEMQEIREAVDRFEVPPGGANRFFLRMFGKTDKSA
jgi:hypothetical protein